MKKLEEFMQPSPVYSCNIPIIVISGLEVPEKVLMKETVSKLTYPTLQHCLRVLYTRNGTSRH